MKTVQVSRRSASYRRRLLAAGALSAVVALSYVDFAYALPLNCDASAAPANGGVGDCTNSLASGSTCQPTCNAGYTVSGPSTCSSSGVLTPATCSANSCDASAAPANGAVGDCTNSLASGSTCQPVCNAGYTVSGTSSCSAGTLTAATCSADSAGASTPIAVALAAAAVPLFL